MSYIYLIPELPEGREIEIDRERERKRERKF